jgi:NADPH:quinone reductase
VIESATPSFVVGDAVTGMLGWQEQAIVSGSELRKLDPDLDPVSIALGILGTPGLTAYFGLLDICYPRPGETVVVSGADGGIGMLVGQIAKIQGCRSVGLSASSTSCDWLVDDLGFDAALRRGTAAELAAGLDRHCPGGIDVYFDNIGGTTTDAVIARLNKRARIAICGQSSQENLPEPELGPRWLGRIAARQARIEGFAVSTCVDRFPEAFARLYEWLHQGRLKYREDVSVGLESAPQAFIAMLEGRNQGKQLVQLR